MTAPQVPNLIRDALRRDGAYDFGLGVVCGLRPSPAGPRATASSIASLHYYLADPPRRDARPTPAI